MIGAKTSPFRIFWHYKDDKIDVITARQTYLLEIRTVMISPQKRARSGKGAGKGLRGTISRGIVIVVVVYVLWLIKTLLLTSSSSISLRGADTQAIESEYRKKELLKAEQPADSTQEGEGQGSNEGTIFNFKVRSITDGSEIELSKLKGKRGAFLIVNVASNCGHTKRSYEELQTLYERYEDSGLEILAFPCNQFKHQEPGDSREIRKFFTNKGATFTLFEKVDVNGEGADPLFKFLEENSPGGYGDIRWNWEKFLVGSDGVPVHRYRTKQNPLSFEKDIQQVLAQYSGEIKDRYY